MRTLSLVLLFCSMPAANAQDKLKVWISNELVPASGGTAQVKIFLDSPLAISGGSLRLDVRRPSGAPVSPISTAIAAATVFSATGDAVAASDSDAGFGFGIAFSSDSAGVGRLPEVPVAVFSYQTVEPLTIGLIPARSKLYSGSRTFDLDVQAGGITLASQAQPTLAIHRVIYDPSPSGVLPPGSTIQINGSGFTEQTTVELDGMGLGLTSRAADSITAIFGAPTMVRARRLRVSQPSGETKDYWLGTDSGVYTFPGPSASAIDCFPGGLSLADPNRWIIHNPNPTPAEVTITNAYDPTDRSPSARPVTFSTTIPAGALFFTAVTDPPTTTVRTSSQTPLRAICAAFAQGGGPLIRMFQLTYPGLIPEPAPSTLVSAATSQGGPIAPGEIVTLFGTGLGPSTGVGLRLNDDGDVSTDLAGVQVRFNGVPAPLLYVSATQVNAVAPYEIIPNLNADVTVEYAGRTSVTQSYSAVSARPGIFTWSGNGKGQGAILNQDNTANGPRNPSPIGSILQIFASGEGPTLPEAHTGGITPLTNTPTPVQPVRVLLGEIEAPVVYAGAALLAVAGLFQVNAVVPAGTTPGDDLPVQVFVGAVGSPAIATVAIR